MKPLLLLAVALFLWPGMAQADPGVGEEVALSDCPTDTPTCDKPSESPPGFG